MQIRPMTIADHPSLIALLQESEGVTLREADSLEATARYLERNPNLSFVAVLEGEIIGSVMSGHDGRRGYLQHLIVRPPYRGRGIAKALVHTALNALIKIGIYKTHCFVFRSNDTAQGFWESMGWERRDQTLMYSYNASDDPNI